MLRRMFRSFRKPGLPAPDPRTVVGPRSATGYYATSWTKLAGQHARFVPFHGVRIKR